MKSLMILGSIVGFVIGISFGLVAQSSWPTTLWRACAAALFAGVLMRWWGRIWLNNLRESLQQQRHSRPAPAAATKNANKV